MQRQDKGWTHVIIDLLKTGEQNHFKYSVICTVKLVEMKQKDEDSELMKKMYMLQRGLSL